MHFSPNVSLFVKARQVLVVSSGSARCITPMWNLINKQTSSPSVMMLLLMPKTVSKIVFRHSQVSLYYTIVIISVEITASVPLVRVCVCFVKWRERTLWLDLLCAYRKLCVNWEVIIQKSTFFNKSALKRTHEVQQYTFFSVFSKSSRLLLKKYVSKR